MHSITEGQTDIMMPIAFVLRAVRSAKKIRWLIKVNWKMVGKKLCMDVARQNYWTKPDDLIYMYIELK